MTVAVEAFTASQPLSYKDQEAERAVLVFFEAKNSYQGCW